MKENLTSKYSDCIKHDTELSDSVHIPTMLSIKETAVKFHVPEHFVRVKVRLGEVVAVRIGRKYLVNAEKFAEYLNTAREPQPKVVAIGIQPVQV